MRINFLLCIVLAQVAVFSRSSFAQIGDLEKELLGEWTIVHVKVKDKQSDRFSGGMLDISNMNQASLSLSNKPSSSFKMLTRVRDEKAKVFEFQIETQDDQVSWGGGGPRKGICRLTDKGELEINECISAEEDYPADFSAATKRKVISWKLTRNNNSPK